MMMRTKEKTLKDELATEHERRVRAEYKVELLNRKLYEMKAFQ